MEKKTNLIIDFEFNGLPRYNFDPEISQIKIYNTETSVSVVKNFRTRNKATIGSLLVTGPIKGKNFFSKEEFLKVIKAVTNKPLEQINFVGFSNKTDREILSQYDIDISFIDIQEILMRSKYEKLLAHNGRSMETCYAIIFKEFISPSHNGEEELIPLIKMWEVAKNLRKKKFLTVYPWGQEAGMPLDIYCEENRRRADGYRYNNNDILSSSLDYYCEEIDICRW